jgi:tRNA(Arg) A34 adenosine deaminase TadA
MQPPSKISSLEEKSMKYTEQESHIKHCYVLAEEAVGNGDEPFGALLVRDGRVVLTAVNTVNSDNDVTRHAETNLVTEARRHFSADELAQCTLYTSTEPCAMCTGAIYAAGIPTIVFGCGADPLYELVGSDFSISSREILALGKRETAVFGPVLEEEGFQIHRAYWI